MNKSELKLRLDELKINPIDYSLDSTLKPMRTILLCQNFRWYTFEYDEHGNIQDKKEFLTESEACEDMLRRLMYLKQWRKKYNIK